MPKEAPTQVYDHTTAITPVNDCYKRIGLLLKLLYLLLFILLCSCQPQPRIDDELFRQVDYATEDLEDLVDTVSVMEAVLKLPKKARQVDSLLVMTDRLKGFDPGVALFYAEQAYDLATDQNWDLQRAISLYYIALMKRRLQIWGGGIEDALVDAEMSRLLFDRLGEKKWLVRVYDLIGIIHYRQYEEDRPLKLDTARGYFQKALETLKTSGLEEIDSLYLVAEIQHDIGVSFENEDVEIARKYYGESRKNYIRCKNEIGLARLNAHEAMLWVNEEKYNKADSLLDLSFSTASLKRKNDLLNEVYRIQSKSLIGQYLLIGDNDLFSKAVKVLHDRIAIQNEDLYHSYGRLGITYSERAYVEYLKSIKFENSDSASFYYDQAYVYIDSALVFYKKALQDAKEKGVLSMMDYLSYNILANCIDKQLEGQGNCDEIFGGDVIEYVAKSYKKVADLMTRNLTEANYRVREMERLENDRTSARKRRELLLISLGVLSVAGLIFLLFLQRAEQKRLKSQMEALRAQINPHFISNSLNAIESLINRGNKEAASKYLIKFSRLNRQILNSSRAPNISLTDELKTIKNFLDLEQLRFQDKLHYDIAVSEGLQTDRIEVPAMILQPYVENAIWHGIKPKEGKGQVSIKIERNDKKLVCIIEDDGIGRERSREMKANSVFKHQSHGMKITEERLKASGNIKGSRIEIIDLKDTNGEGMGTRVIIRLPFKLRDEKSKLFS